VGRGAPPHREGGKNANTWNIIKHISNSLDGVFLEILQQKVGQSEKDPSGALLGLSFGGNCACRSVISGLISGRIYIPI
jgi:hypothetical protein